jgi:hypothetical protein
MLSIHIYVSFTGNSSKYAVDEDDAGSKEMVIQEVVKADHKAVTMSEAVVKEEVDVTTSNSPRFSTESHPISSETPGMPFNLDLKRK